YRPIYGLSTCGRCVDELDGFRFRCQELLDAFRGAHRLLEGGEELGEQAERHDDLEHIDDNSDERACGQITGGYLGTAVADEHDEEREDDRCHQRRDDGLDLRFPHAELEQVTDLLGTDAALDDLRVMRLDEADIA